MAEIGKISMGIRLIPDDDTMKIILKLLDLWQDDNPDMMVAMVPAKDRYQYEIIEREKKHEIEECRGNIGQHDAYCRNCGRALED